MVWGCVSRNKPAVSNPEAFRAVQSPTPASSSQLGVCPSGSEFRDNPRRCVTRGGFVLGPFPIELQEQCRELFPQDAATCVQKQDWPAEFMNRLSSVLKDGCAPGTTPIDGGTCLSSGSVYGPFTLQQVVNCRTKLANSDQSPCDKLMWPLELFNRVRQEPERKRIYIVDETSPLTQRNEKEERGSQITRSEPQVVSIVEPTPQPTPEPEKVKPALIVIPPEVPTPSPTQESAQSKSVEKEQEQAHIKAPTYCIYSWDERPGTADFSTRNQRLASMSLPLMYPLDREEKDALVSNRDFHNMDVCTRARFLKKCFQKVILDSDSPAAQIFKAWALGRVRPVEAHMAFVMKESRLGLWPDQCWKGKCAGVGIARVREARTPAGRLLVANDPMWQGIIHNIATNLEFSLRMIAEKTKEGPIDLHSLAYLYNENPRTRERYATDVDKYYRKLMGCQLDER